MATAFLREHPAVAVFVSTLGHCLVDLLHRWSIGEFPGSVVAVVSNHLDLKETAEHQAIPYHHFPITAQNKRAQEAKQLDLLSSLGVDLVIFARYMQVVSDEFIACYPNRIINIHHSFLPAFIGSSPYARAYERGVKLIGATSHYVTPVLDAGPIIEQDVMRVTHRDTLEDLIRKGRDLERVVLARAVRLDLDRRFLHTPTRRSSSTKPDRLFIRRLRRATGTNPGRSGGRPRCARPGAAWSRAPDERAGGTGRLGSNRGRR